MQTIKKIFQHQQWHFVCLVVLLYILHVYTNTHPEIFNGSFLAIPTATWFWLAIAVPIIHQIYVLLVWRLELHTNIFTSYFGLKKAFKLYSIGFSILFAGRLISIILLAVSNQNTLSLEPALSYTLVAVILPPVIYLFYSVKKYFTIQRAYGIDHFDKNYNEPFEKRGIFKYTDNGMYTIGLMVLYLPGLLLFSKAALVAALFNHIYIWVHYYFTERPDMQYIYGNTP